MARWLLPTVDPCSPLLTLLRGRAHSDGRRGHVVNYQHLIDALRRKPMALLHLVHRDQLFPRDAYRRTLDALLDALDERDARRCMVGLLALAHDRCCEAEALTLGGPRAAPGPLRCRLGLLGRYNQACEPTVGRSLLTDSEASTRCPLIPDVRNVCCQPTSTSERLLRPSRRC